MSDDKKAGNNPTRIDWPSTNPTEIQIRRSCGTYLYRGKKVRLYQDPETGVLEGMTHDGDPVDPLRVLTHGRKAPS